MRPHGVRSRARARIVAGVAVVLALGAFCLALPSALVAQTGASDTVWTKPGASGAAWATPGAPTAPVHSMGPAKPRPCRLRRARLRRPGIVLFSPSPLHP